MTKSIKKQHLGKGRSMANMACGPAGKGTIAQLEYAGRPSRDNPLRQELRALEEAADIKKKEASRMHEQINTLEVSINWYKEEEKAKRLRKLKAEKWSSWKSLHTKDVHREAAEKSP